MRGILGVMASRQSLYRTPHTDEKHDPAVCFVVGSSPPRRGAPVAVARASPRRQPAGTTRPGPHPTSRAPEGPPPRPAGHLPLARDMTGGATEGRCPARDIATARATARPYRSKSLSRVSSPDASRPAPRRGPSCPAPRVTTPRSERAPSAAGATPRTTDSAAFIARPRTPPSLLPERRPTLRRRREGRWDHLPRHGVRPRRRATLTRDPNARKRAPRWRPARTRPGRPPRR